MTEKSPYQGEKDAPRTLSATEETLYRLHAEVCRTLGHPTRLKIVYLLGRREGTPGELAAAIGVSPANLSQHLAALRAAGLVEMVREGVHLRYRLASPEVARACEMMRRVLLERLRRESSLLELGEGSGPR